MAVRALSADELRRIAGTDELVLCAIDGVMFQGIIPKQLVFSTPPDSGDKFLFHGTSVLRSSHSITHRGRAGSFFLPEENSVYEPILSPQS